MTATAETRAPSAFDRIEGTFTIANPDGRHYTVRVRTQGAEAAFAPGQKVVGVLTGPDNLHAYTGQGFLTPEGLRPWRRAEGTILARVAAFVCRVLLGRQALPPGYTLQESRACIRCGRKLTTPESLALGLGPECASRR
jgi:hypothetical protein